MTALAPFEPCPVVDLDTRAPLNQSAFFHRAAHDPESNEAMAASLVPIEPRLELVHSGEPHVVGVAEQRFMIDATAIGTTIGPVTGGWLTHIRVTNPGSGQFVMTQRTIHGRFLAGNWLQLRPVGAPRDLWCFDFGSTQIGGSIGGGFGATLMDGAIQFDGALQILHVPPLPMSFEVVIDDTLPRDVPAPRRSKHAKVPRVAGKTADPTKAGVG